jgi:4-diphosphocytidyl-2-C-methyl-D-erythritol kinase
MHHVALFRILRGTSPGNSMPRAYAKINIGLYVFPRRADGYHDLLTVFHRVDIHDELSFEASTDIEVDSSSPDAPSDETNICYRAAQLLRDHLKVPAGVRIVLQKGIPVGAGLGGGSADAGCVLRELPRFWHKQAHQRDLEAIAYALGADVPYFLSPGSAVGKGRGEVLTYFRLKLPYTILLCNPNIPVATRWAYQQISSRPEPLDIDLQNLIARGGEEPKVLREHVVNDFEAPVFATFPAIAEIKAEMMKSGAVFSLMSGSGSTVYGFYSRSLNAARAAEKFANRGYRVFLTPPDFSPE